MSRIKTALLFMVVSSPLISWYMPSWLAFENAVKISWWCSIWFVLLSNMNSRPLDGIKNWLKGMTESKEEVEPDVPEDVGNEVNILDKIKER